MLAYVHRAVTCFRVIRSVHPTATRDVSLTREAREAREAESFLCLTLQECGLPLLLISSASCSAALVPAKDPTLQYVFIQGRRRQKKRNRRSWRRKRTARSRVKREHEAKRSGANIQEGAEYARNKGPVDKKREEFRGTRSVIIAEVATPASLTARSTAK